MITTTCPGSPWLLGSLSLRLRIRGPLSADSGQSLRLNQSWAEAEAAEPVGGSVW